MKYPFFIIALVFGILASSQMAFASDVAAKMCDDASCQALIQATERAPRPTNVKLVCIEFAQARRGPVVLTIYGEGGEEIRQLAKIADVTGKFCIGKQWLVNAVQVDLCNEDKTRTAWYDLIREILDRGRTKVPVPLFVN